MSDFPFILAQAAPAGSDQPAADAPASPPGETSTQTTAPGDQAPPADQPQKPKGLFDSMLIPLMLMFVVLYFFMLRGPKKKQQQHKQMLDNLKRNDRVRTVGGIIATVVDVRDDGVVLKVDESNNTKMKVIRSAIGHVYSDDEKCES